MPRRHDSRASGRVGALAGHVSAHARGLSAIAMASVIGILSAFAFQILGARYLGTADFGLFSAFLVVVSTAAIGSASLQNIVAVQTAEALHSSSTAVLRQRKAPWDALILGVAGGGIVAVIAPWLAPALDTTVGVVLAAAACVPLSFVFADSLGLLQGSGREAQSVWWSTVSLVIRVGLLGVAVAIAAGVSGVILSVVVATAIAVAGAMWSSRRVPRYGRGAFTVHGITIVALTVSFAWLTSADVLFVRMRAPEDVAGIYASVTVLVKAGFLVPSTLSLYLLPRFVRSRENRALSRIGVLVTLGLSIATSVGMILVFWLAGAPLIHLIYGEAYSAAVGLLVPVAAAYLPWMAAQGMLIKMTSNASRGGAGILVIAMVAQLIAFSVTLPDIPAMLVSFAAIGVFVVVAFIIIDRRDARTSADRSPA